MSVIKQQLILGNGYIEGTELDGFLKEFVSSANPSDIGPEVINLKGTYVRSPIFCIKCLLNY